MPDEGIRESWQPGDRAHFEYHCLEAEDSADAELWHRTHERVTVVSGPHGDDSLSYPEAYSERASEGMPYTYRVRFPDGHEGDAWEDELLTGPEHYYRPGYRSDGTG